MCCAGACTQTDNSLTDLNEVGVGGGDRSALSDAMCIYLFCVDLQYLTLARIPLPFVTINFAISSIVIN